MASSSEKQFFAGAPPPYELTVNTAPEPVPFHDAPQSTTLPSEHTPNAAPEAVLSYNPPEVVTPKFPEAAQQFAPPSTTSVAATSKFPPTMNAYFQWAFTRTFHLGPSGKEKLFAASYTTGTFSPYSGIILHDGPTTDHPVLATVYKDVEDSKNRPGVLTMPARPQMGETQPFTLTIAPLYRYGPSAAESRSFYVPVRGKAMGGTGERIEKFQWRSSHGDEIKEMKGWSYGWKLVRLAGPVAAPNPVASGSRDAGVTSDGYEVVAVLALNLKSLTKGMRFAFLGTGLTGTYGERWESIVVASALWQWFCANEGTY